MTLEVAISTVEDAAAATVGGGDRFEVCAALETGGLTPSPGTIHEIRRSTRRPLMCMIRPRPGGFAYSTGEYLALLHDAEWALAHGADGLVFGCLTADLQIDLGRTRELVRLAAGRQTVFHRAFDLLPDQREGLRHLIDLGVTRVLTSGGRPAAPAGADVIADLVRESAGRIEVLPGGGVTHANVAELVVRTGATQVHGSFSSPADEPGAATELAVAIAGRRRKTDVLKVAAVRKALDRLAVNRA
jgi:copper homeostasis protein